jgi:hypothetical protein
MNEVAQGRLDFLTVGYQRRLRRPGPPHEKIAQDVKVAQDAT